MASLNVLNLYQDLNRTALIKSQEGKDIRFDIKASFGGYADSISPNLLPSFMCEGSINNVGFGTYLEKMIGSKLLGYHKTEEDINNMFGLRFGGFVSEDSINRKFKIVRDENKNKIFFLNKPTNDLQWLDFTPEQGITNSNIYNWAVWRDELYIVSGEKFEYGSTTGGVLVYNPNRKGGEWRVINTGRGVANNSQSNGADGPNDFYPSVIAFYNDAMYLSGSKEFPLQVKFSEHSNPDNIIGTLARPFLGLLDTPPVISDLLRPSTFILNQNGDKINSLFVANDYLWIGTNKRFYAYKTLTVLNTKLPAGLLWLDTLQEHRARAGTYSQKTILQIDDDIQFIARNNSQPGIASMIPIISKDRVDKVYGVKSDFVQNTFKDLDLSNACMGVYGIGSLSSIVFISGAKCPDTNNNITIAMKLLDGTPLFTKISYIHANDWYSDEEGTYWLSSETGEVFELTNNCYTHDKTLINEDYSFVYQTGRIGVATNDQDFSNKQVKYIWLVGCSSTDLELKIDIFNQTNISGATTNGVNSFTFTPQIDRVDLEDLDCSNNIPIPFVHNQGVLFSKLLDCSQYSINYNVLNIRLEAITSGYFALHQLGVIYEKLEPISSEIISELIISNPSNHD